jgi:hypothetical protein
MRLAKPFFLVVLAVALAAYAFDCGGMTTPEQAMQCCDTMACSSHGHEQSRDCCKTMPAMHAPFVQPSSVQGVSRSPLVLAVLPATGKSLALDSPGRVIAAHCHAPPIRYTPAPPPLRI